MDSKKDYKLIQLKRYFVISFIIGVCIVYNSDIDKNEIITLSAVSNQTLQTKTNNIPAQQEQPINEPVPVIQKQIKSSVNAVTETAVKLGILSCVSRINQVSSYFSANNQTGVFIFKPQNQPDQHIFSTSFELIRNDDSTLYASASFFPNQDAVYDTVEYIEKSCDEIEKTVFSNLKRISVIKKNIIVLDGGAVKVFLMPAGSGTIVIKKEVIQ